jgi:8-oxo-dGTP pyrophosphatase MutT (NUDIX family)
VSDGKVCLVTTAGEIALQEAWEEAGLAGVLQREPSGSYLYEKLGSRFHVTVFLLSVTEVADTWPEATIRQRTWLKPAQALARLDDPGLQAILRAVMNGDRIETAGLSA